MLRSGLYFAGGELTRRGHWNALIADDALNESRWSSCFRYLSRETESAQDLIELEATDILDSNCCAVASYLSRLLPACTKVEEEP